MSEEMIPKVPVAPEELDSGDMPVVPAQAEETAEAMPDLSGKSLAELAGLFEELSKKEDRMKLYKEAEAIKSAFYKRLLKEKTDAGLEADVKEPDDRLPDNEETEADAPAADKAAYKQAAAVLPSCYSKACAHKKAMRSERAPQAVRVLRPHCAPAILCSQRNCGSPHCVRPSDCTYFQCAGIPSQSR